MKLRLRFCRCSFTGTQTQTIRQLYQGPQSINHSISQSFIFHFRRIQHIGTLNTKEKGRDIVRPKRLHFVLLTVNIAGLWFILQSCLYSAKKCKELAVKSSVKTLAKVWHINHSLYCRIRRIWLIHVRRIQPRGTEAHKVTEYRLLCRISSLDVYWRANCCVKLSAGQISQLGYNDSGV